MNSQVRKVRVALKKEGIPEVFAEKIIKYVEVLGKYVKIDGLLLFGSVARGKIRWGSDIDLIVISRDFNRLEFSQLKKKIAKLKPAIIEALWFTPDEFLGAFSSFWGLLLDAVSDGRILLDELHLLKELKIALDELIRKGIIIRRNGRWILCSRDEFIRRIEKIQKNS